MKKISFVLILIASLFIISCDETKIKSKTSGTDYPDHSQYFDAPQAFNTDSLETYLGISLKSDLTDYPKDLYIPSHIGNSPITGLTATSICLDDDSITFDSITIPKTVLHVNSNAFDVNCTVIRIPQNASYASNLSEYEIDYYI